MGRNCLMLSANLAVIPAPDYPIRGWTFAGIQLIKKVSRSETKTFVFVRFAESFNQWIPAFAGMTVVFE